MEGRALQHRQPESDLLRPNQHAQEFRRHRHRRHVSGREVRSAGRAGVERRCVSAGGGSLSQGRIPVRARRRADDSVNNTGIIYSAFGAQRVDANGEITVDSPAVHAVLDCAHKLGRFLPPDAASYDDTSNNRALISGKSALIMKPPSAWAVAKRDAPKIAKDCWHFPCPIGPEGRYIPYNHCFYGAWSFGTNLACTVSGCIDGAVPGTNPIPADAGLPPVLCP
jgi:hypothetical protein